MARLSWAAGILIGITIAVGPRLLPRLRGPEVVRLGHAFYVLSGRRLDACWAIRLISVDGGDVNPWRLYCLSKGWNLAFGRSGFPWADGPKQCTIYKTVIGMCDVLSLILLRIRVNVLRSRA